MTIIENKTYIALYGKFYDANLEASPNDGNYDIIIYSNISKKERRTIGSLEGIFASSQPLSSSEGNDLLRRDQMADFEKKYNGRFMPFNE